MLLNFIHHSFQTRPTHSTNRRSAKQFLNFCVLNYSKSPFIRNTHTVPRIEGGGGKIRNI